MCFPRSWVEPRGPELNPRPTDLRSFDQNGSLFPFNRSRSCPTMAWKLTKRRWLHATERMRPSSQADFAAANPHRPSPDTIRSLKMDMNATYQAIAVPRPGEFSEVSKPLLDPGPNQIRIRVEACGVCHSDSGTVEGLFPIDWPRVPGHEVVGRIDALGSGVQGWAVGQRVGVGFLGGSCGYCEFCRGGDLVNCRNQEYTGIHHDGGYAEVMIAKASGLMSIPNELSSAAAAPLLCAGLTTFNALRNAPAKAGDLVAVVGIGGLGHLGVQYARHMGFEVAAIARGADKAALAKKLGAHHYIDSAAS